MRPARTGHRLEAQLVRGISALTRSVPRVKGLGIPLGWISRLFAWDIVINARIYGNLLTLNPKHIYERNLLFVPQYHDRAERAFMRRILRGGDYVVDVGANIGTYALQFARLVGPSGKVTAIEAVPKTYQRLRSHIAMNGFHNVRAHQFGVAAEEGLLPIHLDPVNHGANSFMPIDGAQTIDVRCVPLSKLVDADRRPRFLKIDVEGFEYPVLKRYFDDTAPHLRPHYIMLEDWAAQRVGDSVALCLTNGYRELERHGANVMLEDASGSHM